MKLFDKQEIMYATTFEKEGSYIEYEVSLPNGWYALYPLYDPRQTCSLEDFGIFMGHGGKGSIRFSLDRSVPYSEHEYPKAGEPLALITYFKEEKSPSEKFNDMLIETEIEYGSSSEEEGITQQSSGESEET